jgi:hypothetical protein
MNLLFLSQANLRDTFFMKSLAAGWKLKGPTILLHDHFGSNPADTRFVTKRISAMLSENMIVNNAFSGEQRGILTLSPEGLTLNEPILRKAFATVALFITNPLASEGEGIAAVSSTDVLRLLHRTFAPEQVFLFPANQKSPLASSRTSISSEADLHRLLVLYEEESEVLHHAFSVAPATIASPTNFSQ